MKYIKRLCRKAIFLSKLHQKKINGTAKILIFIPFIHQVINICPYKSVLWNKANIIIAYLMF